MKFITIILFYLCLCIICNAQVKFIGSVKLHNGSPVESAIIIAKIPSEKGERIVANTRTDEQGHYAFKLSNSSPQIVLYISNFNIKPIRKEIANISQTLDFVAESQSIELEEVYVKPTIINAKGDTLTYHLSHFRDKNDRKLRETLERLPGITINDAGRVLYNGREITEFQIEGGNLFEGKYSIALERIDPKDIIAVDIMQHHQPIRALQGSRITDDVALNVKLSPNSKNTLTGKMEVGGGYREGNKDNLAYTARLYGGLFNAKHQIFVTASANNSGEQLRDIYAVPLTSLSSNLLSSPTPQSGMLNKNDYMTNKSEALSINGLYNKTPDSKWNYAIIAMNENTEGCASMEYTYHINQQEKTHKRSFEFGNNYRNIDFLLKYEQNKSRYFFMNKLVGTCNRELPFVKQLIQAAQLDESLNQREFALDNKLRLIYKWNEVNGLDTQFNLQFTNSRELLFLAQEARINSLPQPTARQEVKQKFYYAELRQEMLSTIRLGNCTFDPYWFGIADKNMLTAALYSSGLFSPESSFALSDDMHYNRAKAGIGLSFQSVMAHFRIYGYIPLVYSHISVYSPYITPQKHSLHILPNLTIERSLLSHISLQLQWSREVHDNKPEDFLQAFIIRNSYEQTRANINDITSTNYHYLSAKINYANGFKLLFGNLRINYNYLNSDMMTNKVIKDNHIALYLIPLNFNTHSLSLSGELSKAFYWKKTNVGLKVSHTRFSSSQMLNDISYPFQINESSFSLKGGITPVKGLLTEIQMFLNRSCMSEPTSKNTDIVTTRAMLIGKIMATFRKWSISCNTLYSQQDHTHTFLANAKLYYKTKLVEWSLNLRNLFNAQQLNIVSVNAQEHQRNTFFLVPRSMILSLKFNL